MKNSKYLFLLLSCTMMVLGMHIPPEIEREIAGYALTTEPLPPVTQWLLQRNRQFYPFYTIQHNAPVSSVAMSSDGKIIVTGSMDSAKIWNAQTGRVLYTLSHNDRVHSVAISPDGKIMVTCGRYTAKIWSVQTWEELYTLQHDYLIFSVATDGKKVVTGSHGANIWDVQTGEKLFVIPHYRLAVAVAISPDGKIIVTGSSNGTAKIWDDQTGQELYTLRHNGQARSVATDGKKVVVCLKDTAKIGDIQTRQELHSLPHGGSVWSVAISRDGKVVVTGSSDGTAKIWDVQTGQELYTLPHNGPVRSIAISPDGRIVVTGSYNDNTAKIWRMPENLFTELTKLNMRQILLLQLIHADAQANRKFMLPDNPEIIWEYDALPNLIKHLVSDYVILPSTLRRIYRWAVGAFFNVT